MTEICFVNTTSDGVKSKLYVEIVEEMKEREREERETEETKTFPHLPLPATKMAGLAQL